MIDEDDYQFDLEAVEELIPAFCVEKWQSDEPGILELFVRKEEGK